MPDDPQTGRTHDGALIEALQTLLGDRLSLSEAVRQQHGRDESYHEMVPPDAVAFPRSTAEVAAIVSVCAEHGKPIVPFGTGTSLEGGIAALTGGVSIDLSGGGNCSGIRSCSGSVAAAASGHSNGCGEYSGERPR